ncbi:MAG TPA: alpha/beta hydrolase, partial [bacterium]
MKVFKIILVPLVLAYFSILLGYVVLQRKLIFHPVTIHDLTPKNYDLSYQNVSFPSYDGVTLTGWWMQHPKSTAPRPVLLYCHGNADDLSMLAEVSRLFYDFGFDELLFDYRSYGASEKAPKGLSEKALDGDALAAYQWVKAKGFQDKQMMIWGHSLGSSVAAWLATQTHPAGL